MTRRVLAALAAVVLLAGCDVTVEKLPLPGGGVDGPTYQLKAVFADALNLPDKAHVRLGGVTVGAVDRITTRDYVAHVEMSISTDVRLPRGTTAQLRQPTPLGDVFLAVNPPKGELTGPKLADGATIPLSRTSSAATVEDSLAAATLLINGGGLGHLKTITREANAVFEHGGRRLPHLLDELRTTIRALNSRSADIDKVLAGSNAVAKLLKQRRKSIDTLLTEYPPAMDVLSRQTERLTSTLRKVSRAGGSTVSLTQRARPDLNAMLRDLGPVLDGFTELRGKLGPTLRDMITLGKNLGRATEGHALAGVAILEPDQLLYGLGGPLPDADDLRHGFDSVTDNIADLVKRLGGGG